jgi:hypothetical protein
MITVAGDRSFTLNFSSKNSSARISENPFSRMTSLIPGIMNIRPMAGLFIRFSNVSSRLLPGRSGMATFFPPRRAQSPAGLLQTRIYRRDKLMVIMPVGHELANRPNLKKKRFPNTTMSVFRMAAHFRIN